MVLRFFWNTLYIVIKPLGLVIIHKLYNDYRYTYNVLSLSTIFYGNSNAGIIFVACRTGDKAQQPVGHGSLWERYFPTQRGR
jgi:hypothetical protein